MGDMQAIEMLDRSSKIAPIGLAVEPGHRAFKLGRFADAATVFEAALRLDAKAPLTHGNLGVRVRLGTGRRRGARFTVARQMHGRAQ